MSNFDIDKSLREDYEAAFKAFIIEKEEREDIYRQCKLNHFSLWRYKCMGFLIKATDDKIIDIGGENLCNWT